MSSVFRLVSPDCGWSLIAFGDDRSAGQIRDCCLRHRSEAKADVSWRDGQAEITRDLLSEIEG